MNNREALYRAAISCRHEITHDQIILYVDSRKEGNALSQLADRLEQAALASQAQQTESQWINLKKDDYSHLKGNELIYAYGIGCGIFEAYLKDYEVVREDMFNRNTSEVTHIMVRIPVSLPPAPEGDKP